jgi:hypothetical protein
MRSRVRGGPRALKHLQWARHYAKMADLPPAISQAPEGPQGRSTRQIANCRERPRRMVALWGRKLGDPVFFWTFYGEFQFSIY